MSNVLTIVQKEFKNFLGSEKGVFIVYAILVIVWSFLPAQNNLGPLELGGSLWWLFFSVIISGNFSNTVFVSERMNGSMEIMLTSGFSRNSVLFGKVIFVMIMSVVIGTVCLGLSVTWTVLSSQIWALRGESYGLALLMFTSGTFLNAAFGAWMSIRIPSPRLIPFVNLLLVGVICGLYYALHFLFFLPFWLLAVLLLVLGCVALFFAQKDFHGEKVIAPLDI